jgi:hypothetical protein
MTGIFSLTRLYCQVVLTLTYINSEVIKEMSFEGHGGNSVERQPSFDERIGGPLKPNDFLTTKSGIDESRPILENLGVPYKVSLFSPEIPLNELASAPSEYRIEVMDPNEREKPAPESYVRFAFGALREAGVPISRGAPVLNEEKAA